MIVAGSGQLEDLSDHVLDRLNTEFIEHADRSDELPSEFVIALFPDSTQYAREAERLAAVSEKGAFVLIGYPGAPESLAGATLGVDTDHVAAVEDALVLVALGTEVVCALVAACDPATRGFATRLSFSPPLVASAATQMLHALRPRLSQTAARTVRGALDAAILAPRPDDATTGELQGAARLILAC